MKIKVAFREEDGNIISAEVWAHPIRLPDIDLQLAIHPRYGMSAEKEMYRMDNEGYQLTEVTSGFSIGNNDSVRDLIGLFLFRARRGVVDRIKSQLQRIVPIEQRPTINAH